MGSIYRAIVPQALRVRLRKAIIALGIAKTAYGSNNAAYAQFVLDHVDGRHPRECTICGKSGHFLAHGYIPRLDSQCPECKSLERHRWFWHVVTSLNLLTNEDRVLHFAPEGCLSAKIRGIVQDYVTADLYQGGVDKRLDICSTGEADAQYDCIVANEVLEHVDDRRAIREMARIIKPGGRLIVSFPYVAAWRDTYEDDSLDTDALRDLHFGQHDHLRIHGDDIFSRFGGEGFSFSRHTADGSQCVRYGLTRGETLFVATRQ